MFRYPNQTDENYPPKWLFQGRTANLQADHIQKHY